MARLARNPLTVEPLEARVTPTISFGGGYGYDTGGNAAGVAVGDFTGDGKPDMVVSTAEGMNTFANDGTGKFTGLQVIGGGFGAIELADMDGDGKRDIVCSDYTGGTYRVLLGNGNGTFQGAKVFAASSTVHDLRVADMNGDGKLDVVTSNGGRASVRLNDGTVNILGALVTYEPNVDAEGLTVGDFNGDNKLDVALAGYSTDKVYVLLNTGSGALGTPVPYCPGGGHLQHITAGDFNNDSKIDLAAADVSNAAVRVLLGNGDGTFAPGTSFNSFSVGALVAADYDGDGYTDIAASSFIGSRLYVYPNDGAGVFGLGVQAAGGINPSSLKAADVNADGRLDLLSTNTTSPGSVTIAPNTAVALASFTVTAVPSAVAGQGFDVTVTARDASNAVLTGYTGTVTFTSTDPLASGGGGLPANYTFLAGENGVHTFTGVTLRTAGPRTVTATSTVTASANGTAKVSVTAGAVTGFGFTTFPNTTVAGAPHDLTLTARDQFNNTVTSYTGTVSFTSTDPLPTAGNGLPSAYQFTAGENGVHTFTGVSLKTAGTQSITATDTVTAGVTGTKNGITVTAGAPAAVALSSGSGQSAAVNTPFAALVALVTDSLGNPVPGATVTFAGPLSGAGFTTPGGSTPTTAADGKASVTATANTTAGSFGVTAKVGGVATPATFNLTSTPGAAAKLVLVSGSNQEAYVTVGFPDALIVRVADAFDNPVPGVAVTFDNPASGAGVRFITLDGQGLIPNGWVTTTAADGTGRAAVIANATPGTYTVQATAAGVAGSVAFALENSPPLPPVPNPSLVGADKFAVGSGPGQEGVARFFRQDHTEAFRVTPFPGFTGGVRVTSADVTGDGVADLIVASGPGGPPRLKVFDGSSGAEVRSLAPFEDTFTGGLYVSAGDLTGEGTAEIVISPDEGGGPRVTVLRGGDFVQLANFFGIDDANFRGGVRTAVGDIDGDGVGDLVVAAGFGGGPRVAAFDGTTLSGTPAKLFNDFFVFEEALRNGAFVTAGDLNGDGFADLIGGGGPGGGPRVLAFSASDLLVGKADGSKVLANFFAGNPDNRGGVRVAVKNLDNDLKADLVVGDGAGAGSRVTAYRGSALSTGSSNEAFSFDAFAGFSGGVFVG